MWCHHFCNIEDGPASKIIDKLENCGGEGVLAALYILSKLIDSTLGLDKVFRVIPYEIEDKTVDIERYTIYWNRDFNYVGLVQKV